MEPNHGNTPSGSHGTASSGDILPAPLALTAPVSGPAGSSAYTYTPPQGSSASQTVLHATLESSKRWLDESGLTAKAQQLPQAAKDLGTKAWASLNSLSTTQKAVGVGLLTAGIAFLATRARHRSDDEGEYRHVPHRSPFAQKPYGSGQRPWGSNRSGNRFADNERIKSGSGYSSVAPHRADRGESHPGAGPRRDQGPAAGSRYDVHTSGGQNPNNLDQLNSAF